MAAAEAANPGGGVVRLSDSSRRLLAELDGRAASAAAASGAKRPREEEAATAAAAAAPSSSSSSSSSHLTSYGVKTSAAFAGGFTSSGMAPATRNAPAAETEADARERRWARAAALGKKGYVRLRTTQGDLNVELHVDLAPRTCENFLLLAARGYYAGVPFHRSIRSFMLQGGDPTGTGRGGASAWAVAGDKASGNFRDEFHARLSHSERGVLSMANAGPHTNGSQFFVLYRASPHLDRKHSVFGRVVGGLQTLADIEAVPVDKADRPLEPVTLLGVDVLQDPFAELDANFAAVLAAEERAARAAGGARHERHGLGRVV
jgi:peptidyl-prolyl cis-trans isomerase-like protein 2